MSTTMTATDPTEPARTVQPHETQPNFLQFAALHFERRHLQDKVAEVDRRLVELRNRAGAP